MAERQSIERLGALHRRWKAESFAYCCLLGLTFSMLMTTVLDPRWQWPWWTGVLFFLLGSLAALFIFPYWRLTLTDITRYLDRRLPELEESCGLLLRPAADLGPLQQLQAARTEVRLRSLRLPRPLRSKLLFAGALLFLAIVLKGGVTFLTANADSKHGVGHHPPAAAQPVPAIPGMRAVKITITPPAYTGRASRSQTVLPLQVEEGALVTWEVELSAKMDTVLFLFNDTVRRLLQPVNADRTTWRLSTTALHPGFYQVRTGASLSQLYKFEILKDEPPRITVQSPKAHTLLDYGESTKVPLEVQLHDDYGISDAAVMATVSSGKGEAVKFKEQELKWNMGFTEPAYHLSKTLDLSAMGLRPGDELYFYCRSRDNHGQESRTDMYIITLADTAQLMSLEGMTVTSDVKPEFFRSQRQIIIETEQLLKEKDTLAVAAFNSRSNDLGFDQKLLRLRYGKFLGEEAEEGEPAPPADAGAFGDAAKILDAYTDKHDNAEDATFFEPAIKAQLKATLSEMWKSELQLRTYKPREALPYAYKALRLLKDLQQQSRSYVAKTGVRLTPLNPAKRLTGELAAITAPVQRAEREAGLTEEDVLRIVLGLLEESAITDDSRGFMGEPSRSNGSSGLLSIRSMSDGSRGLLAQAERRLGVEAARRPGEFLTGYQAMKRIVGRNVMGRRADGRAAIGDAAEGQGAAGDDILLAQQAIKKLLPASQAVPFARKAAADAGLSQLYFSHIDKP